MKSEDKANIKLPKHSPMLFIVLIGLSSLFTDMTYQGARSIAGPFFSDLGANALIISTIYGAGELIGHGLRLISGYIVDRWRLYWAFIVLGYLMNALTIPFLSLAPTWQIAASLILIERIGKAIRSPARDTLIAQAGPKVGMGWGFGIHKSLDQFGAMLGPLAIMIVMFDGANYREAFATLLIPALLTMVVLTIIYKMYPDVKRDPTKNVELLTAFELKSKPFWVYMIATSCIAAGYADFPLIAYHLHQKAIITDTGLPGVYTAAMGMSAISSLLLGKLFDRANIPTLMFTAILSSLFPLMIFYGSYLYVILGIFIWAIGMGAHESLMKSMVANITPTRWRGSFFGIFNTAYGIAWFLGSVAIGYFYEISILYLVIFSTGLQLLAIPLLIVLQHLLKNPQK